MDIGIFNFNNNNNLLNYMVINYMKQILFLIIIFIFM